MRIQIWLILGVYHSLQNFINTNQKGKKIDKQIIYNIGIYNAWIFHIYIIIHNIEAPRTEATDWNKRIYCVEL